MKYLESDWILWIGAVWLDFTTFFRHTQQRMQLPGFRTTLHLSAARKPSGFPSTIWTLVSPCPLTTNKNPCLAASHCRPSSIPGDIDLAVSAYSWTPTGSGAELGLFFLACGNPWVLGNPLEVEVCSWENPLSVV